MKTLNDNPYVLEDRDEERFSALMEGSLNLDQNVIDLYARNAYDFSVQALRSRLDNILHFE